MEPLRILYLVDTVACATAGTERQILEVLRRLDRRRFAPLLIALHRSPWMERAQLPCAWEELGYRGFLSAGFPAVVRRLRRRLQDLRPDVVQTFFEDSVFVGALAALGLRPRPVMLTSRRDIGLGGEEPWYHALFRLTRPIADRAYDAVVANGSNVRRHVARREHFDARRIHVIPNGVEIDDHPRGDPPGYAERRGDFWIVATANLKPVKRLDLLIEALARVVRRAPDRAVRLALLGEGPEREKLQALARSAGVANRIVFAGSVEDPRAWLARASAGVSCSDREGLSNAILEYMSCGLPVVATAVGDSPDLIDESNGFLVPPGDPAALADAIGTLIDDPAAAGRLGRASREKVERRFGWAQAMAAWEALYLDLAAPRSAHREAVPALSRGRSGS